jgi:HlyD family secretion protein
MEKEINIKSDEITEILGTPPRWIVRWGITLLFLIIAVVLVGCIFFKYPDTVFAPVVITAENPPSLVVARANGKMSALFVNENTLVGKGDTLGVIENPANHTDIFDLSRLVSAFESTPMPDSTLFARFSTQTRSLGDLQQGYNTLLRSFNDMGMFRRQNFHELKIEAIAQELQQHELSLKNLERQKKLSYRDLTLTRKQYSRDSLLFKTQVIAAADFERTEAQLLAKQQGYENYGLNINNTAITIGRLKQSIIDTRLEHESRLQTLEQEMLNAHRQLKSMLASWEKAYLLISPTSGRISFMGVWSDMQEVKAGAPVFAVIPENMGRIQARMTIPFEGAGKVRTGQRVNIKLDGYPYMEFGMVEGKLELIASGYGEKGYPAVASLPNGAVTSYGVQLQIDRELLGMAEITTEDLSVMERLFSPLKHILRNNLQ